MTYWERAADAGYPRSPGLPVSRSVSDANAPGASPQLAVAVSTLTQTAKQLLERVRPLWVRGEVCDFKAHRNGHWYFCLRDATAQLRCVVWSSDTRRIPAPPDEGMQVVAYGQLSVYPARGDVQLQVSALEAEGDGLYEKAKRRTIAALQREGLLAPGRKRALPARPRCVAVVTSLDGAALHDVVAVIRRRSPAVQVVVVGARVQGDGAPESLCLALDQVCRWGRADIVIIGRGGGLREDLWAFNDERVARAVAACVSPTISAVGHEVDVTVCDLVADLRAATPSAAAEAAVPVAADDARRLRALADLMCDRARRRAVTSRVRLEHAASNTHTRALHHVARQRARFRAAAGQLDVLSPLVTLSRGFAAARALDGTPLLSAAAFGVGDPFDLILRDGSVRARTEHVRLA
jgi:exodeoxyribonuclease VII large subunit